MVKETPLQGCFLLTPQVFEDERGSFTESFNQERFKEMTGVDCEFVQDNQSVSRKGVLRGLHFQTGKHAQAKLIRVVSGSVLDVVVDCRKESPTFGHQYSVVLDDKTHQQLYIPKGFAHGFLTLSETAIFCYKCDEYYHKESESGIIYNDPTLAIDWQFPMDQLIISDKDKQLPTFDELFR